MCRWSCSWNIGGRSSVLSDGLGGAGGFGNFCLESGGGYDGCRGVVDDNDPGRGRGAGIGSGLDGGAGGFGNGWVG